MRVLLVNPPKQNFYRRLGIGFPPLGLGYLASVLREARVGVLVADLDNDPGALGRTELGRFDLVGISADTIGFPAAMEFAGQAAREGVPVLLGGYHVTFQDWEALRGGVVDFVIRGEGERPIVALVKALQGVGRISEVPSLSFVRDGRLVRTPEAEPVRDLDGLPFPAWDLFPIHRYKVFFHGRRAMSVYTSRGCPFHCSFCVSSSFNGIKWRARSASSVADEVEILNREYGFRAFAFIDDNFTLDPRRVVAFTEELDRRRLDIIWWCFSRVDTIVKNEEMVARMAEAGARRVFMGLESGSQEVLNRYGKGIATYQQEEAISILRRHGIETHGGFILGHPEETKETIKRTIDTAVRLNPYCAQFSMLTPYPGTKLYNDARRENRLLHRQWQYYDGLHSVVRTDLLTPDELQGMLSRAYRRFYLRLSQLRTQLYDMVRLRYRPIVEIKRWISAIETGRRLRKYGRRLPQKALSRTSQVGPRHPLPI